MNTAGARQNAGGNIRPRQPAYRTTHDVETLWRLRWRKHGTKRLRENIRRHSVVLSPPAICFKLLFCYAHRQAAAHHYARLRRYMAAAARDSSPFDAAAQRSQRGRTAITTRNGVVVPHRRRKQEEREER
jgi:hypothetical protein